MADLSDETQRVKSSHLPRTDFELCILDMFNMLGVPSNWATVNILSFLAISIYLESNGLQLLALIHMHINPLSRA